jgi:MFS transporter, DHA3 family, tetracycline resistance protein
MPNALRRFAYVLSSILERRQHNKPVPIYLVLMASQAICFSLFFTIQLIYQVTVVGLNPFQMVLVGTVLEVICFSFEVPTGIVADVYSRRLSILIGVALIGCAYILEGGVPKFWAALVGQVFWGVGYTFTSGATEAWITDEIGEDMVGPVFLRGRQMWLVGVLTGTAACVGLGLINVQLPMVLAGVGMIALTTALVFVMPERHMHPVPPAARSTFAHMKATGQEGIRLAMARPVVKVIITISLFVGLAAEAFDRLRVPLVIDRFDFPTIFGSDSPVIWFGISSVAGTLLGLAATELFRRRNPGALGQGSPARFLSMCAAIQVAVLVVFALSGNIWLAFGMLWMRTIVDSVSHPVESAWLNRNLDASTRATVSSMTGQANSIGQVGGGLALGWVGNAVSIQAALIASAFVLSPTIALYRRLIVRDRAEVEPVPTPAD